MKHYLVRELYTAIPAHDLPEVKVNGWVRTMRESKAFAFVELNDGSYFRNLQIILEASKLDNYAEAVRAIGVGAAIGTTSKPRGSSPEVSRLIAPPFPAASQPSKTIISGIFFIYSSL